jgi:hypothetical protein
MAKNNQVLLESIFDAACVIESSLVDQYGKPYPDSTIMDKVERKVARPIDMAAAKAKNLSNELTGKLGKVGEKVGEKIRNTAVVKNVVANKKAYKAGAKGGLLGLGLGAAAAGTGAYALHNKLSDVADETGEHINSLRDKLASMISAHQEA